MAISSFKTLAARKARTSMGIQKPEKSDKVTEQSPATDVMTDFARVNPVTITSGSSLFQANETMIAQGVRLLLVVSDERQVMGIVSTRDTLGERPMQLLHQGKGNIFELTVADLMHGVSDIAMLDFDEVRHANVGDIVATLKQFGQQHLLVAASGAGKDDPMVRGVFSATQIGRQLGVELQPFETARTFAEIEAALVG